MAVTQTEIHGVWKLLSFNLHLASNTSSASIYQPLGPTPLGRIMFLPGGYMSCTLTSSQSLDPIEAPNLLSASDEDVLRVARSLTTYCGPYRTHEENGKTMLTTDVEIALDPNWIGGQQVRRVQIRKEDGKEYLVLSPVQNFTLPDGTKTVGILEWEKIEEREHKANL